MPNSPESEGTGGRARSSEGEGPVGPADAEEHLPVPEPDDPRFGDPKDNRLAGELPGETVREADAQGAAAQGGDDLAAELAQLQDRYRRALADLDNYRKRAARDIERRVTEARESVTREWLDAVDSVERALRLERQGPCADGLRAVLEQMDGVLARHGVRRIGAAGERFDPAVHEAIAIEPSGEVPERTILAVERSGYVVGDRLLRPAQVVVARAPEHVT
jgi:molecular chaperone GrpE